MELYSANKEDKEAAKEKDPIYIMTKFSEDRTVEVRQNSERMLFIPIKGKIRDTIYGAFVEIEYRHFDDVDAKDAHSYYVFEGFKEDSIEIIIEKDED